MFQIELNRRSAFSAILRTGEVVFHATVRHIRKGSGNAIVGLLMNMLGTIMMVTAFTVLMSLSGLKGGAIRGDFILYVMSGIFLFITHTQTMAAVSRAEGMTSQMMKHSPMNPVVAILAAALSQLYVQLLSATVVLYIYHAAVHPIHIDDWQGMMGMFLLAWGSGVAIGMVAYAFMPWAPRTVGMIVTLYQRINMIASGKMFLANSLPAMMLSMFDWNPLFHIIDQNRGFIFLNYLPRNTNITYPLIVTLVFFMIGLMGIFYTRNYASASWNQRT
ncbi:ABC transporter permease [Falsirhodobacter sp. 20TX0035]|uniref:ABC transporter permease n=1 Tax=Falsirhodobacter sp. 20TX0035 TaxID=3022019 RepID=UPI00232F37CA|nr:ABC transporter permease [Falsirhodobacter sp. 20TX0035]MDB6452659.1 ABC transporter permease [Falsirhodobacter sp. 20TX0035]